MKHSKESKTKEHEDLHNKYLRALADYQNLEKRLFNEKREAEKQISYRILERFLLIMDDIERAQSFHQDDGLVLVAKQFKSALEDFGVTELDLIDKPFDPYSAEALELVEGEIDNIVVEVIRKGYQLGDTILRPAQVRVSKTKLSN